MSRRVDLARQTSETNITGSLDLDGIGAVKVDTGLGFFDHMLTTLAKHSGFDLELAVEGDLVVDDHHTVEDCAIVIGRGIDTVLGDRDRPFRIRLHPPRRVSLPGGGRPVRQGLGRNRRSVHQRDHR